MSHRTQDLPPAAGITRLVRELRYHEGSRQSLAVLLILLFALTSKPVAILVYLGLPMAFVGMLIRFHASGYVRKNKELATDGPYALMRHPLYTGNILLVVGFALAGSLWWNLLIALVFFWFYYPPAIEYEDRKLRRIFGEAWEKWAEHTPALLPNFGHASRMLTGNWSFSKSTMENGEIFIAIYLLGCMALIVWRMS